MIEVMQADRDSAHAWVDADEDIQTEWVGSLILAFAAHRQQAEQAGRLEGVTLGIAAATAWLRAKGRELFDRVSQVQSPSRKAEFVPHDRSE